MFDVIFILWSIKFNYSSIDNNDKEFAGHVIFKIGSSMYEFNFMTGDKKQTREEMLSKDGLLFGKITYLDEKEQLKVVCNLIEKLVL